MSPYQNGSESKRKIFSELGDLEKGGIKNFPKASPKKVEREIFYKRCLDTADLEDLKTGHLRVQTRSLGVKTGQCLTLKTKSPASLPGFWYSSVARPIRPPLPR